MLPQPLSRYWAEAIKDINITEGTPVEPLTLQNVKDHLRLTFSEDDTYLNSLIAACRAGVENYCLISLVAKDIQVIMDLKCEVELPYGPAISVTSAAYKNGINDYEVKTVNQDYEVDGVLFKTFIPQFAGRWKVIYTAGYTNLPADLILDLKRVIGYVYENRGDQPVTTTQSGIQRPRSLDEALELFASKYRRMTWL